jgi:aspartokinase-like uncharacterized kinase
MTMTRPVVIKVGGSLFDWPELPGRLTALVDDQRTANSRIVLIAGGGPAADFVRQLDRTFALGDVPAHHLAVRTLDLTAHVLAALVPGLVVVDAPPALDSAWAQGMAPVFAPYRWLDQTERRRAEPLPPSWDVTSDSIAARLAVELDAAALVLLKSTPLPHGTDRRAAARLGLVDPHFPDVSSGLSRVVYLDFRADQYGSRHPWQAVLDGLVPAVLL